MTQRVNAKQNVPTHNAKDGNKKRECWVLASNNKGKLSEFNKLFDEANLEVDIYPQSKFKIEDAVEDGLTFVENAIIKARHASKHSGLPAIADDSGLCVPILVNAPGIHSARYAGEHGNDGKNNAKLLEALQPYRDVKNTPITGYFVCILAMVQHPEDPLPIIAQGLWQGEILESPRGKNGFGYDPLFWIADKGKTSAELDADTKNKLSHRGRAIRHLLNQLRD